MYPVKNYSRNTNYVLREVHDSFFLIDITDNYFNGKCKMLELNEIGAFIWNCIEKPSDAASVTDRLLSVIIGDVDPDEVFNDVEECLINFENKGIALVEK